MKFNAYTEQASRLAGLSVVSCGHIFAKPGREICRPRGREDWLLFYVVREEELFFLQTPQTAKPGSFLLFAPGEKQHHMYCGQRTAEFYYVHFHCESLPETVDLQTSTVYELPLSRQICDIFEDLLRETLQKQPLYESICACRVLELLHLLNRQILQKTHPHREHLERIGRAVQHMNRYYDHDDTLEDYARLCAMSKYHFIRVFQEVTGKTPLAYRSDVRLEHAAEHLLEERLSVSQIAAATGFGSAAYFSSAFRKKYGVSPRQYQQLHQ